MDFETYPGTIEDTTEDRVAARRFTPGPDGYARFVTADRHIPPLVVAGWAKMFDVHGSASKFDGLHVHVGHVGNARNYVCSLVRRDGGMKVAVEYGWHGYTSLASTKGGPDFVQERVYHFEVVWERDRIRTFLGSEGGHFEMDAAIPAGLLIPYGAVGLRLDNLDVVGDLTVRTL